MAPFQSVSDYIARIPLQCGSMPATSRAAATAPLRARKQEFVRGAIWDAAVDLFVDRGYDATTVDDIARSAGVSRRSFFRYFASKDDLMGHGIITYASLITAAIRGCPPAAAPLEAVRITVGQVASGAVAHPRVRKIAQIASTSVAAREAQLSRKADLEDAVAEAFKAREKTRSKDELTARLWLNQEQQDIAPTIDRVFAELTRLVCHGTGPKAVVAQAKRERVSSRGR
jgi:TetR/AcrR family transcriptional regulator, regulator of mycofactocin system